jgi:hypothetical protein
LVGNGGYFKSSQNRDDRLDGNIDEFNCVRCEYWVEDAQEGQREGWSAIKDTPMTGQRLVLYAAVFRALALLNSLSMMGAWMMPFGRLWWCDA